MTLRVLGAFAIQPTLSLPTGSAESGRGSGKAAVNVLAISSHRFGPVSLDVNAGYTRLGGESTSRRATARCGRSPLRLPIAGRSAGPPRSTATRARAVRTGQPPVVALLTGPNLSR